MVHDVKNKRNQKKPLPFEEKDGFTSVSHDLNREILKRRIIHVANFADTYEYPLSGKEKGLLHQSKLTCTSEEKYKMHHAL
jgi:RecJ-like exonuclease